MFKFLRNTFHTDPKDLTKQLQKLHDTISKFENNRFETRAYVYLDVFSWLEAKLEHKTMGEVIKAKYLASKRK